MALYELAQLNVALPKAPLDAPDLADFVANIDRINALAEQSPGFVWRLRAEDDTYQPEDGRLLSTLSVWRDVEALHAFVYRSDHGAIMRRRKDWFERLVEAHVVLWWVPAGQYPTTQEGLRRLEHLRAQGPTPDAFTFRHTYPAPDASGAAPLVLTRSRTAE